MEYMAKNIPLWQITTWDKNFNNVDKEWQPKTIKYKYLLSDELDSLRVDDGDIRILYTGKDVGYTTEELAGDNISEGEVVSIPWGGIPTVKYHKGKFVTGDNRIATSNDTSKLTNKYLYYYLQGNIGEIASYYRGASLKHPCMKDVLKMTISYPSVQEQEKICSQFDMLEWLIEARKQELQLLDDLIKARFVELFGNPVLNEKGWESNLLAQLTLKIGSGATPKGGREAYQEEGIALIRSMNVYNGKFEYKDLAHISDEQAAKLDNVIIKESDVLLNITGASVARSCVVPNQILPARVNQHVCIIRCKECIEPIFLNRLLIDDNYQKLLWEIAGSGATREAITKQQVERLKIILPPIELQNQFAAFVAQVHKSKLMFQKLHQKLNILQKKAGDI